VEGCSIQGLLQSVAAEQPIDQRRISEKRISLGCGAANLPRGCGAANGFLLAAEQPIDQRTISTYMFRFLIITNFTIFIFIFLLGFVLLFSITLLYIYIYYYLFMLGFFDYYH